MWQNINMKKTNYINIDNFFNMNKRIKILLGVMFIFFVIIVFRIVYVSINFSNYYEMLLDRATSNIVYGDSVPRGRIYDRNMKLLVDNVSIKSIYYKKEKDVSIMDEVFLAYDVGSILELDYDDLSLYDLKKFYMILNEEYVNEKITDDEYDDYANRKISADDLLELKFDRITDDDLSVFTDLDKRAAYVYYLMNNGYYYDEKVIKVDSVSDYEYAYISENSDVLKGFIARLDWDRVYLYGDTLKGILGSVSSKKVGIPSDFVDYYLDKGYSLDDRVGISGIELEYEDILRGEKAKYKLNDDNSLTLVSEGKRGNDIVLSIDIDLQVSIDEMLEKEVVRAKNDANTEFYNRSFIVIQNPNTGEIMSMSGKELFDDKLSNSYEVYDYAEGAIISTITPGSVVKGASMIVGYNQGVIDIGTTMLDQCIKLYNLPQKCSWRSLGVIDDAEAIKYSSNVYQYKIAMMVGGFDYAYNKELKIDFNAFNIYRNTFYQFGLGVKTGVDFPYEEDGYKGGSYAGDLLINYAIGQYDTYTPLQLSQYISTIANGGYRIKPHFLKQVLSNDDKQSVLYEVSPVILNKVETEEKYLKRVQYGMRLVMESGTGVFGYMGSSPLPAGKTGTSESFVDVDFDGVVDYETMSNNFVGFAPYNNPIMSITASSPDVQNPNKGSYRSEVNLRISKEASNIFFSYYNDKGERK